MSRVDQIVMAATHVGGIAHRNLASEVAIVGEQHTAVRGERADRRPAGIGSQRQTTAGRRQ